MYTKYISFIYTVALIRYKAEGCCPLLYVAFKKQSQQKHMTKQDDAFYLLPFNHVGMNPRVHF